MKFKSTAIAMAVAGTVAAPVAVQAGADEVYASARVGVWNVDQGDSDQWQVRSFSSRFGAKGETDLGNGLTGFGHYEWDVDFGNAKSDTVVVKPNGQPAGAGGGQRIVASSGNSQHVEVRHRYVGLKGDFGSVLLGHTYHTFYNFVVGPNDNPWWHSGYAMVNYKGRKDNAVTYAGGTGAINFGATVTMVSDSEEEEIDETELGFSIGIGDTTLGVAIQSTETTHGSAGTDDDIVGVAWSGIGLGPVTLGVGYQNQEDDDSFLADVLFGNAYLHVEQLSVDATDQDRMSLTLGYTQSLGRKTTMWYEINSVDNDTGDSDDDRTAFMAVLKYDII